MLSFSLHKLVVSTPPLTNYWNLHPRSPRNGSFAFPDVSKCSGSDPNTTFTFPLITSPLSKHKTCSNVHSLLPAFSSDSIQQEAEEEDEEYHVLTAVRSKHNDIIIVDTPKARMLLLDSTHNVHSILNKGQKWTGSYWLIDKARQYFGLSDLEKHNMAGGILDIHIGDALRPSENDSGRYAGIVIDLFYEGKVLAQLQEVATWLNLKDRLMPNGRFMVNCGGIHEKSDTIGGIIHPKLVDGTWVENSTIKALFEAFPGQVSWKRMPETQGANFLALTGPFPDLTFWSSKVPDPLSETVRQWRPYDSIP
ncbi:uncharacterized protein LOC110656125 isoform X2 [Hevea brasiliensis]|uniref:uncharacterized protein LOC110656125 isoform X2 n=1 Tax=Hevea brasiliensis TaxID=3981 RepID=UPI0025F9B7C4|nr:uncharacterized protein LOC110656125 isoform X2 [Hevea brasiliensis]